MYRTVDCGWADDPKVAALPRDGKLLFIYLVTNRHTHVSGIYYLPDVIIGYELGLAVEEVAPLWSALAQGDHPLALRDGNYVWVVNMLRHQGRGEKNERAAANHLSTLHCPALIEAFLGRYPHIERFMRSGQRLPRRDGIPPGLRFKILTRDKFTCCYCGCRAPDVVLEIDHIHPVSKGGKTTEGNLRTSCASCNQGKWNRVLVHSDTLSEDTLSGVGAPEQYQEQKQEEEKGAPLLFKKESEQPLPDLPEDLAAIPGMTEAWQDRLLERKAQKSKGRQTPHQVTGVFKLLRRVVAARGPEHALFCVQRATANCHQGIVFDDDLKPARKQNGASQGGPEIIPPQTLPTPIRHLQSMAQDFYREQFRAGVITRDVLDGHLVKIRSIEDREALYKLLDEQKVSREPQRPKAQLALEGGAG